jgi:hypothetical protein
MQVFAAFSNTFPENDRVLGTAVVRADSLRRAPIPALCGGVAASNGQIAEQPQLC